jgi:hypothetical protein
LKGIKYFLILCCFFIVNTSYADDAAYFGDGADVYPLQHTDVQLVSETITIIDYRSLNSNKYDLKYRWLVQVNMTFKNHGPDTSFQMGFPLFAGEDNEGDDNDDDSAGKAINVHFRTWIDGKEIRITEKRGIPSPVNRSYRGRPLNGLPQRVFTYPVTFKKDETKKITHSYNVGGYFDSIGSWKFTYILRTGALWKDNIEDVTIYYKTHSSQAQNIGCIMPKEQDSSLAGNELTLIWKFSNYKPTSDFVVSGGRSLGTTSSPDDLLKTNKRNFSNIDTCGMRELRNQIYASYGYPFKSSFIRAKFYYPNSPYKENVSFVESNVAPDHRLFLDYLTRVENWKSQVEKKRISGFFNYDKEFEPNRSSFETAYGGFLALNREKGILVFGHYENLLLLHFPDCIPFKHFTLPLKLDPESVKALDEDEEFYQDNFSMLSSNGKYLIAERYYHPEEKNDRYELLIIDVDKEKLIQKIPISKIESEYKLSFSADYRIVYTVNAAYNIFTGKKTEEWVFQEPNIKEWTLQEHNEDSTYLIYTGTPASSSSSFSSYIFKKVKIINKNSGSYQIINVDKIFGSSNETSIFKISSSPDGRYLAGVVITARIKAKGTSAGQEFVTTEWVSMKIMIWRVSDNSLVNSYEQDLGNNYEKSSFIIKDINFIWHRSRPYLFMTKSNKLWRFDVRNDDISAPVQIPIENIQGNFGIELNDFYVKVYGRFWDLETGKKFWPWYEALDPFDTTNQLPLYDKNPLPVKLRDYWGGS